jgi:hypothetical protein
MGRLLVMTPGKLLHTGRGGKASGVNWTRATQASTPIGHASPAPTDERASQGAYKKPTRESATPAPTGTDALLRLLHTKPTRESECCGEH